MSIKLAITAEFGRTKAELETKQTTRGVITVKTEFEALTINYTMDTGSQQNAYIPFPLYFLIPFYSSIRT